MKISISSHLFPDTKSQVRFLNIARFFGDDIYKEKDWQTYSAQGK